MTWGADFLRSRISVPIVLAGTVLIIGLVKLTSLLPERYYFNFSTLVSSDASPFIVEPPGITYARLCDIARKHHLGVGTFSLNLEGCARVAEQRKSGEIEKTYGQKNESLIYRTVYANEEGMRRAIEDAARTLILKPVTLSDIQTDLQDVQSLEEAVANVTRRYHAGAQQEFVALIAAQANKFGSFRSLLEALPAEDTPKAKPEVTRMGIDEKGRDAFIRAVTASNASLASPIADLRLEPISKGKLDEFLRSSFSRDVLFEQVIAYYITQIGDRYVAQLLASLRQEGIDAARDKRTLDKVIREDGMGTYLVSMAVRLAPVLLFGLLVGLIFGAREITSAAVAAGLAAFLLAWPVVLLWDRVVSHTWQDKRHIFFAFYILYVLAFFVAARFAAGVGATIRGWLPGVRDGGDATEIVPVSLLRDLTVAVVVNALFYVGNALLTL